MRIDKFNLIRFGHFSDFQLDMSEGEQGLFVIYGDNEAGKSTSLRALRSWLFGIDARTTDNFRHDHKTLRLGGSLRLSTGQVLEFVRRKGNKRTLLSPEETPLRDDLLDPYLGGMDVETFSSVHGIDHDALVAGGRSILDQGGDVGQALFSAALGTANLRQVQQSLLEEAEALFKPRASKPLINSTLTKYKDATKRAKAESLRVSEWQGLEKQWKEAEEKLSQVDKEIQEKHREKSRIERLKRAWQPLHEYRRVQDKLSALGDVVRLPEDIRVTYDGYVRGQRETQQRRQTLAMKSSRVSEELEALLVRNDLLDNEKQINELHKRVGAIRQAIDDRSKQEGKRQQLVRSAETASRKISQDLSLEQVQGLRPKLTNKALIDDLAAQRDVLDEGHQKLTQDLRRLQREKAEMTAQRTELGVQTADMGPLQEVYGEARDAGDLDERAAEARREAQSQQASLERALKRLGRFKGTARQLSEVSLPSEMTIARFEQEHTSWLKQRELGQREVQQRREEKHKLEEQLRTLLEEGEVPTDQDLQGARKTRDERWELVRRHLVADAPIREQHTPAQLANLFQTDMNEADRLADLLRAEAERVERRAHLEARLAELETQQLRDEHSLKQLEEHLSQWNTTWQDLWTPLGVEPAEPREMRDWRTKAEALVERFERSERAQAASEQLSKQLEKLVSDVNTQLQMLDAKIPDGDVSLKRALAAVSRLLENDKKTAEHRRSLDQSLADNDGQLHRNREEFDLLTDKRNRWDSEWAKTIAGLPVTPSDHPKRVQAVIAELEKLFVSLDEAHGLAERIEHIDAFIDQFRADVRSFMKSLGESVDGEELSVIERLQSELKEQHAKVADKQRLEKQLRELDDDLQQAELDISRTDAQMAGLREKANTQTNEQLEEAIARSNEVRQLEQRKLQLEDELSRVGDGHSIELLAEQISSVGDIDDLGGLLQAATSDVADLTEQGNRLRDQRNDARRMLEQSDGQSRAALAQEEAQQHLSSVAAAASDYLKLRIAHLVLTQQIERFRQSNQTPLLKRAGEIFEHMTLGGFKQLRDELDEKDKPVLLGVRSDNDEVGVEGMSEGTRDQLYLALRIATLEQNIGKGEPMPFIADDVLVGFDDARTKAGLDLLADLAGKTQVLLFTHHARVVELAEQVRAPAGVFVRRIEQGR